MPRLLPFLPDASAHRPRSSVRLGAALVASLAAVAAWTVVPPTAGATAGNRTAHHGQGHHDGSNHGHHQGGLPVVSHATSVSDEPVIHRGKGRPPTHLETRDLVKGTGAVVKPSSTVVVKYVGANFRTGKDFTAQTWQTGQPATFSLSDVVRGFAEGLVGMKVGGRREIVIPPKLGYDDHPEGPIKKHETLVFVVDLVSVRS